MPPITHQKGNKRSGKRAAAAADAADDDDDREITGSYLFEVLGEASSPHITCGTWEVTALLMESICSAGLVPWPFG